jgi:endonuclease V-like protein UPF0215 family
MIHNIRAIKGEIRTLGLDACNPAITVGVILRGSLYLDGVISFPTAPKNSSKELSRTIMESAYFPELRAVMLHNPTDEFDSSSMERITNLSTIAISEAEPQHCRRYMAVDGKMGRLWVNTRLESTSLARILAACWAVGKLPEPLRVAHLLAKLDFQKPRDKE